MSTFFAVLAAGVVGSPPAPTLARDTTRMSTLCAPASLKSSAGRSDCAKQLVSGLRCDALTGRAAVRTQVTSQLLKSGVDWTHADWTAARAAKLAETRKCTPSTVRNSGPSVAPKHRATHAAGPPASSQKPRQQTQRSDSAASPRLRASQRRSSGAAVGSPPKVSGGASSQRPVWQQSCVDKQADAALLTAMSAKQRSACAASRGQLKLACGCDVAHGDDARRAARCGVCTLASGERWDVWDGATWSSSTCLFHVPKTAGTALEQMLKLPHSHLAARDRTGRCGAIPVLTVRDPLDRLLSAFGYCRRFPWDAAIAKRNLSRTHCCHSSVVKKYDFALWAALVLHADASIDCTLPGVGWPLGFLDPASEWVRGGPARFQIVRQHCLSNDSRTVFGRAPPRLVNANPQGSDSCAAYAALQPLWKLVSTRYRGDFDLVYGRVPTYEEWKAMFCLKHAAAGTGIAACAYRPEAYSINRNCAGLGALA